MTENSTLTTTNQITFFDKIKIVAGAAFVSSVIYRLILTNTFNTPTDLEYLFVGFSALTVAFLVRK